MLTNVQVLRAVAAFLVVFVHLQPLADRLGLGPDAFTFGNSGVDVFFVISGMIMVMTTSRRRPSPAEFIRNRIARIVPFYWLMTVAVFALAAAAPQLMTGTHADLAGLIKSLLFVPYQRLDGRLFPIVFVGWTLNYEMAFYVLFAAGLALGDRRAGFAFTVTVLLAATLAGALVRPTDPVAGFYSALIVLEFALGMVIGAAAQRIPAGFAPRPLLLAAALAAFAVMVAAPALWPHVDRLFDAGLPAVVVVACAVALEKDGWILGHPLLRRLGDASFAIYLTHFFVTQAVIKTVEVLHLHGPAPLVLAILATFPLVALAGVAVHLLVERPLSASIKAALSGRRAPAARASDEARDLAV